MYILFILSILLLLLLTWAYWYATSSPWKISSKEARELLRRRQFDAVLDVRTATERNTIGYYPGSLHIPSSDLVKKIPQAFPNYNTRFLVYCNTGQRARRAVDILQKMGYKNTRYIVGPHTTIL